MDELVGQFILDMKLASGLVRQRAMNAWYAVSGAERFTIAVSLEHGTMICTMSSSVVRNQLYFQKDALVAALNRYLEDDGLFPRSEDGPMIRNLILR